ncbi:hypothetical protein [Flavobacterium supellecticarium]|uniref:hypothetical protein n=1 Tax=Flavobacterium supellecticarium TaxID=2565924 RepID=UPI001454CAE5|nr:hypothetical protein [Flavobacterium supellecticarium]
MTEENIEKAYIIMAKIVRDYGEKYMPIFERMHEIREAHKSNRDLKNIALLVAQTHIE